jgi:hypothetical protein
MKSYRILFLFLLITATVISAAAQQNNSSNTNATTKPEAQKSAPSEEDLAAIKQTAMDYMESWYEGSAEKIERALHPDLAKRIVRTDAQGRSRLDNMGAMALFQGVRAGYGKQTPKEKQIKEVYILDVFGNTASVKAVMSDWIDYMHIAKLNGRWVIVNVLWEMKPKQQ